MSLKEQKTKSLYENGFSLFLLERGDNCIACTTCQDACNYGVHERRLGFNRMNEPKSENCIGAKCIDKNYSCIKLCPRENLRVKINPSINALGDLRWTPELIISTYQSSETGEPPEDNPLFQKGRSAGGFDLMDLESDSDSNGDQNNSNSNRKEKVYWKDIDLSIPLNMRGTGSEITLPFPIYGGGMSFGSVSLPVMLARAMAANKLKTFTSTGEGGYPDELLPYKDNIIVQVATGLFGIREEIIKNSKIVEFKYAQGAKPGLGGHLLGDKVTPRVAELRQSIPKRSLFSPFPFHSVYSVEDHKKHIDWIKSINPDILISVKVSSPADIDMVAVGSYYAGANIIHIDGGYGGTGASPDIAKKNIAMPIEFAILKAHTFLQKEGIRDEVVLIASGGIRTAHDIAKAIALGADGVVLGTSEIVALECIRCRNCESGRGCPRGIATTDEKLEILISPEWGSKRIVNLYQSYITTLKFIVSNLGLKSIRELRGRLDLIKYPVPPID